MKRLGLALGLGLTCFCGTADASPEDLFGDGARTSALGATGAAHGRGYESAWHNPALASMTRETKLTLGFRGATYALRADDPSRSAGRVSGRPMKSLTLGAEIPVPFGGVLRDRVGIAVMFATPPDVLVRGRVLYPERPQFPILADRSQSVSARIGLGVDVGWGIRIGVGAAALAELVGSVVVATDPSTGRAGSRVDDELVATYAPTLGVTVDVPGSSKLRVGIVARGELAARFSVLVDGTKLSSIPIPLFNIAGIAQWDPAQAALEVARIGPLDVLAAQFVFKRWSAFPGFLEPTVACAEGGVGACGLTPPAVPWRDTMVVRIGAEQGYALVPGIVVRARGGGFVESSPLPASLPGSPAFDGVRGATVSVPTRYYDATRVALTTGAGIALDRPWPTVELDLFVQHHVLLPREIRTEGESSDVSGRVMVFGMTAGARF